MARSLPIGFRVHIPEPIEVKLVSKNLASRDSIDVFERFEGLFTYVVEDDTFYYLSGGITNANWKVLSKPGINAIEILDSFSDKAQTVISGFGVKKYLEEQYVSKQDFQQAINSVTLGDHIKNITYEQIQKWNNNHTDKHQIHTQSTSSMTWIVNHNLNKKPSVQSFLPNGVKIEGMVEHVDDNVTTIKFSKAIRGFVTIN